MPDLCTLDVSSTLIPICEKPNVPQEAKLPQVTPTAREVKGLRVGQVCRWQTMKWQRLAKVNALPP